MGVKYILYNDFEEKVFDSEKEACEFLGVHRFTVSSYCDIGSKCKGWSIRKYGSTSDDFTTYRLYGVWCGMRSRCHKPTSNVYHRYGGRGIKVCDEWRNDFRSFYDWAISHGYKYGLSIDRIDNNGNYEPSNCRWATAKEQNNNTRRNRYVYVNGEKLTISQCSEKYHVSQSAISYRDKHNLNVLTVEKLSVTDDNFKDFSDVTDVTDEST